MLATHVDAENCYSKLRREALAAASEILRNGNGPRIHLTEINVQALSSFKNWESSRHYKSPLTLKIVQK